MHCVASMQVKAALKAAEADARRAAEDAEEDAQIETMRLAALAAQAAIEHAEQIRLQAQTSQRLCLPADGIGHRSKSLHACWMMDWHNQMLGPRMMCSSA